MIRCILCLILLLPAMAAYSQTAPPQQQKVQDTTKEKVPTFTMNNGNALAFFQVNLGQGEFGFRVEVQCNNKLQKGSRIEFRVDKPKGKIIGSVKVEYTGDTTHVLKLTHIPRHAWGIHDIYVIARGSGGNLFTISSFSYIRTW